VGVLYDYFRTTDDATAATLMESLGPGGPTAVANARLGVDAIDLKGIDPDITLAKLVGFVRGRDWINLRSLWYEDEQEGPGMMSIDDVTRDALASIITAQMPELSARWGQIDELAWAGPLSEDEMLPAIEKITALAQRARDAGEHLYCWWCL
jgi:hypothetical protein